MYVDDRRGASPAAARRPARAPAGGAPGPVGAAGRPGRWPGTRRPAARRGRRQSTRRPPPTSRPAEVAGPGRRAAGPPARAGSRSKASAATRATSPGSRKMNSWSLHPLERARAGLPAGTSEIEPGGGGTCRCTPSYRRSSASGGRANRTSMWWVRAGCVEFRVGRRHGSAPPPGRPTPAGRSPPLARTGRSCANPGARSGRRAPTLPLVSSVSP